MTTDTEDRPETHADLEALRTTRRSYRAGAALGVLVFLVILSGARTTLLSWTPAGDFYDAQAESLLDGRLDVDADRLGIEAFTHDGRAYMYQPPWPAVVRLPVVALTDRFDGRLGGPSMLFAQLLLIAAVEQIVVEARRAVRPNARFSRLERVGVAGFGLVVAGGSVPTFLASRPWVYHEAALWGAAWALVAVAGILVWSRSGRFGLPAAAVGCAGAVASRASVGAGTCAALGVLALVVLVRRRGRPPLARLGGRDGPLVLLAVAALPALGYAALNVAKFGTPASIPFEDQAFTAISPARQAMLEENGGTLFGLQFAPTTLLHYLRPTGIRLDAQFPFVDFPPAGGPVVGDVTFDLVDHAASIPASLPALLLPALGGVWLLTRDGVGRRSTWAAVAVGGSIGSLTIVPFGYVAHRYLADTLPLLVPLAALGWQGVLRTAPRRRREVATAVAAVGLVLWTTWANVGLATVYQRLLAPNPPPELVAGLIDARLTVGERPGVVVGAELPATASAGDLAAIGDCRSLYVWDGAPAGELRRDSWIPVERTRAGGRIAVRVDLDALERGRRYALVTDERGPVSTWIELGADGLVAGITAPTRDAASRPVPVPVARPWFEVVVDPVLGEATVALGDRRLVSIGSERSARPTRFVIGPPAGQTDPLPAAVVLEESADPGTLCRRAVG